MTADFVTVRLLAMLCVTGKGQSFWVALSDEADARALFEGVRESTTILSEALENVTAAANAALKSIEGDEHHESQE